MDSSFDHRLPVEPAERQIDQFARFAEQVPPEKMEIAHSNASPCINYPAPAHLPHGPRRAKA